MFSEKTASQLSYAAGKVLSTMYEHPMLTSIGIGGAIATPSIVNAALNILGFTDRRKMLKSTLEQEKSLEEIAMNTKPKENTRKTIVPFLS